MTLISSEATITGSGSLTSDGEVFISGVFTSTGIGTLNPDGLGLIGGISTVSGTGTLNPSESSILGGHSHMKSFSSFGRRDFSMFNLDEDVAGLCGGMILNEHPPDDSSIIIVDQRCVLFESPPPPPPPFPSLGLILDLDASTIPIDNPTIIEGGGISLWSDQSPSMNDGIPTSGGSAAIWESTGIAGGPSVLMFGGSRFKLLSPIIETDFTLMMIIDPSRSVTTSSTQEIFMGKILSSVPRTIAVTGDLPGGETSTFGMRSQLGTTNERVIYIQDPYGPGAHIITVTSDGAGSEDIRLDNTSRTLFSSGSKPGFTLEEFQVLGRISESGSTSQYNGRVGRFMLWDRVLTLSEIISAETISGSPYGL